jgi:hypothetical protein
VLRGGVAWRLIPKDLPPRSTVFGSFSRWRDEGVFARIHHHLDAYSGEGDGLFRPMVIIGSGDRDGRRCTQGGVDRRRDCLSH